MRLLALSAFALTMAAQPPVVFVHGNGDDAAKWMRVMWLFESNGHPKEKLHAVRFTNPSARLNDEKFEPYRWSSAGKVVLIGSSGRGNTIRNYVKNGGGAGVVSHAILCGASNHGVFAMDTNRNNEFNANSAFLAQLNEGDETVPGVRFLRLSSDRQDKYAQPNATGYDNPMLQGAVKVVPPGLDHREGRFGRRRSARCTSL